MSKEYDGLSLKVLHLVGGTSNINDYLHCVTRLRINVKDKSLVNLDAIKSLDIIGTQFVGDQLQIIIGKNVNDVYATFDKIVRNHDGLADESKHKNVTGHVFKRLEKVPGKLIDGLVGCLLPMLPILIGAGLIKAGLMIIVKAGWLAQSSPSVVTLSFVVDSVFYFMPIFLGAFAAKKFRANLAMGMLLGAILLNPTFVDMVQKGNAGSIFGIPIYPATYSSSILPIIISVWLMSYIEIIVAKFSPKVIRNLIEPVVTLLIMVPLTLCIVAPAGTYLASGFRFILSRGYAIFGPFATGTIAALVPFIVMTGMHVGTVPIAISEISRVGKNRITAPAFMLSNFAQGAACLAVAIKAKDKKLSSFALGPVKLSDEII